MELPGRRFAAGETIYSDWYPRGGDNLILRTENIDSNGSPTVTIKVYTKNDDETGDGDIILSDAVTGDEWSLSLASTDSIKTGLLTSGKSTSGIDGMKQQVRLVVEITGTGTDTWMLARVFPLIS